MQDLAFVNRALQYAVESGTFEVSVGSQSQNFQLAA